MRSIVMLETLARNACRKLTVGAMTSVAAAFVVFSLSPSASAAPRELGLWLDDSGKGAVKIDLCGNRLCGRIVWLRETVNADGEPLVDRFNPDDSKKKRRICGLQILGDLQPMQGGGFDLGWVYDPKVGSSYSVAIDLKGPDELHVTGYKGVRFLGKTFVWTRVQENLPPCDAKEAKADDAAAVGAGSSQPAVAKPAGIKPTGTKPAGAKLAPPGVKQTEPGVKSATSNLATGDARPKPAATKKAGSEQLPWDNSAKPTVKPTAQKPPTQKAVE